MFDDWLMEQKKRNMAEFQAAFGLSDEEALADASRRIRSHIYLWTSIDLSDATAFKRGRGNWPNVFRTFYRHAVRSLSHHVPGTKVWKHVGDKVLFYLSLKDLDQLSASIPATRNAILELSTDLRDERDRPLHVGRSTPEVAARLKLLCAR